MNDNRTLRRRITIIQRYNKTIVARCDWGPWVLYIGSGSPRLGFGFASGSISPLGCTKRHGPHHNLQQLYNVPWLRMCTTRNAQRSRERVTWVLLTGVHYMYLDRSHRWLISTTLYETITGSREQLNKNCYLNNSSWTTAYSVVIMF